VSEEMAAVVAEVEGAVEATPAIQNWNKA